jgi:hypothetical protein
MPLCQLGPAAENGFDNNSFSFHLSRSQKYMAVDHESSDDDGLRPEYNLSKLSQVARGRYMDRFRAGTNLALLAPEVRAAFPTDAAVNQALRTLMTDRGSTV